MSATVSATPTALAGLAQAVPPIFQPGLASLRQAWLARLRPGDAAELAAADAFVAQVWLAHRLDAVEERLLGALIEGRPIDGLPSLATLVRARARREREREHALAELARAQRNPQAALSPQAGLPEAPDAALDAELAAAPLSAEFPERAAFLEEVRRAAYAAPARSSERAEHAAPELALEVGAAADGRAVHAAPELALAVGAAADGRAVHAAPEPALELRAAADERAEHAAPEPPAMSRAHARSGHAPAPAGAAPAASAHTAQEPMAEAPPAAALRGELGWGWPPLRAAG